MELVKNGYLKKVNLTQEMKNIVTEIMNDISSAGAQFINSALFKSADTYQMDHAINVTVLAVLIGKKYGFKKTELMDLALGSFLHDFGKIVIEKMKENDQGTVAEELLKEHPTFGYLIVSNSQNASPIVSQIVNQHHENQDGTGFPIGLIGENLPPTSSIQRTTKNTIYRLAEICRVADAYDNFVMNPKEKQMRTPSEAMKEMILGAGTAFNKHIVNTLTQIVPSFPVGSFIKVKFLVDPTLVGYRGVVAKINEEHIHKPTIILLYDNYGKRIQPRMIETAKYKAVELELVL
jgi:HD-GYP domain-containing protein (c-di-GMP phosphodiesterase class II)